VDGLGGGGSKEDEDYWSERERVEDREEWSKIVEQTKTHPGL
jgi:hypothetical protein